MPMLCLSYSSATSILSLHQLPSAALTPAYFTFCLCCIFCLFPSNATTGSNDQIHCRHPDYVCSTCARITYPTCFRRLPSGMPSPVLRYKTIYYLFLFGRISIDVYRLRCPKACCYYRRRLPQLRITRMKSHPGDYTFNFKNVITWCVVVGGLAICPIPGNKHHSW